MNKVTVRVPASSANLGSGFDSLGIALNLYNYVTVAKRPNGLKINIKGEFTEGIPKDENNLVFRAIKFVAEKAQTDLPGLEITLTNHIPPSRGLGSSSAGIVGGIVAANALFGNPFKKSELIDFAAEIEGHPDNIAPAITGGFVSCVYKRGKVRYISSPLKDDLNFAAFVPDFYLRTKKARSVLPKLVHFKDAVFNISRSALLTASLITGDYSNLRSAVDDRIHQNYRKRLIPDYDVIFRLAYRNGALGVFISGAGPTLLAMVRATNLDFSSKVSRMLNKRPAHWKLKMLKADNCGAILIDEEETEIEN